MQAPKIPSFFKVSNSKSFSFKPRYYDKLKERRKQLKKGVKADITFNRYHTKKNKNEIKRRIVFLIIILSLLAYKLIIN